jgi:type II secretory ATPase GspE/PulE/Tfp pilus assembly ATPase PilB-like protein
MAHQDFSLNDKLAKLKQEAEEREAQRIASRENISYLELVKSPIDTDALALIPEDEAKKTKIAAIEVREKKIALAALNPKSAETQKIIDGLKKEGYEISLYAVSQRGLTHAWSFYRFIPKKTAEITTSVEIDKDELAALKDKINSLGKLKDLITPFNQKGSDTGRFLETVLAGALANRVSDVHFEPEDGGIKLRMRIDGMLRDVFSPIDANVYSSLILRIKLASELKVNVHKEAQDGRFTISLPEKDVEVRTSIIPSEFGETAVLRILDPDAIGVSLEELGFRSDDLALVKDELDEPNGMILNTGPTGSGKTTTLYAFLKHSQNPEVKIITIEDPIEYHLDGIEQTQVNPEAGYTFGSGLRSILRQDPDMILIGEIRDMETAEIAVHSALTGHLVFSTLHTNDAAGAIPRLVDIGIKPSVIAPAINLIIAQRLLRKLCPKCRIEKKIDAELQAKIDSFIKNLPEKIDKSGLKEIKIFKANGCLSCNNTGYKGRVGAFELLKVDDELETLISKTPSEAEIKSFSAKKGMATIQEDGLIKALSGITTLEEVERITGNIIWEKKNENKKTA